MTPRGIETGIGALSWEYPERAGLPGTGSGPVGESGIGPLIHDLGAGWGDALPVARGYIIAGHQKPGQHS